MELARFGPFVFGKIRDEEALFHALSKFQIDAVIHFAAPDVSAIRDYAYVMDLAQAHIRALDVLESRRQPLSNVGTGSGASVQELVHSIEQVFQTWVNTAIQPIREGDPPQLVVDNTYLKTWFQHDFSSLTDVIRGLAGRAGRQASLPEASRWSIGRTKPYPHSHSQCGGTARF